jgi:hypothetical protein
MLTCKIYIWIVFVKTKSLPLRYPEPGLCLNFSIEEEKPGVLQYRQKVSVNLSCVKQVFLERV